MMPVISRMAQHIGRHSRLGTIGFFVLAVLLIVHDWGLAAADRSLYILACAIFMLLSDLMAMIDGGTPNGRV